MKITLISLDQEVFTIGVRILSACLRKAGYPVQCVFLPVEQDRVRKIGKFVEALDGSLLDELVTLCADSDLVGTSLLSNHFTQAVQITEYLHQKKWPATVIWGGIGPTVEPEECIKYADIVSVGEEEDALLELVDRLTQGKPHQEIENLWVRDGDGIHTNSIRPLLRDLDSLPIPDYSCFDHYISYHGRLVPLTPALQMEFRGDRYCTDEDGINYPILTSRGCPFSCSYCCNSVFEKMYRGQRRLRWRGSEQILQEYFFQINSSWGR